MFIIGKERIVYIGDLIEPGYTSSSAEQAAILREVPAPYDMIISETKQTYPEQPNTKSQSRTRFPQAG